MLLLLPENFSVPATSSLVLRTSTENLPRLLLNMLNLSQRQITDLSPMFPWQRTIVARFVPQTLENWRTIFLTQTVSNLHQDLCQEPRDQNNLRMDPCQDLEISLTAVEQLLPQI